MNIKQIKQLAAVLQQADLTTLEVTEGDSHIRLERVITVAAPAMIQAVQEPAPRAAAEPEAQENDFNDLTEVKSPMVGVYYAAPSPDSKPFIKVGDRVEKGQTVCVIEAMKLMNDVAAPVSGTVVDICVTDGSVLEYGQTIVKIM